ncbi:MAG: hypothetical protein EOP05_11065 [Proteobacteria bacterium]|nr:MAG: hypothetical protein EOP05_11065 [Pseudomonadota bacterium]
MHSAQKYSALDHLEDLIDELIKDNPEETLVRLHMKAAGMKYSSDPVSRLSTVLTALEQAREQINPKDGRRNHGKDL